MDRRSRFSEGSRLMKILRVMRKRLMKTRLTRKKLEGKKATKNRSRVSSAASHNKKN